MIELHFVGVGPGDPDLLSGRAARAIGEADFVLIPRKGAGKDDLAAMRRDICARYRGAGARGVAEFDMPVRDARITPYAARVEAWHDAIAAAWETAIAAALEGSPREEATFALLVWGDPSLYDSTLRIAARLRRSHRVRVTPGITALQALTAAHAIPLNAVGGAVAITTGRLLRDEGWPPGATRVAVMLDGECSFATLDPAGITIWWGVNLGLPEERLIAGPLAEASPKIRAARAAARSVRGWAMDVYLLAREGADAAAADE